MGGGLAHVPPEATSWVRWASSTMITMLDRSFNRPASLNRKIVVMITPRASVAKKLTQFLFGPSGSETR